MITCSRQDGTAPSTRQATTPGVHVRHDETQSTKLMRPAINETDETQSTKLMRPAINETDETGGGSTPGPRGAFPRSAQVHFCNRT